MILTAIIKLNRPTLHHEDETRIAGLKPGHTAYICRIDGWG